MKINEDDLREWIMKLNADPVPENVKKNEDQSLYIPISITQKLLDEIFFGLWSYELLRESYGRKWARANGKITYKHPISGDWLFRSGDAAIHLTGNLKLDSPRLEALVLLSCAKKICRSLGRDLNRDRDDAPLPVIKVEKVPIDEEVNRLTLLIENCDTVEKLKTFELLAKTKKILPVFNKRLKELQ